MYTEDSGDVRARLRDVRGCLLYLKKLVNDLPDEALEESDRIINARGQAASALIYLNMAMKTLGELPGDTIDLEKPSPASPA
jgi:hypothetical protein